MRRHQGAKVEHFDISNMIYHKFSHSAVFPIERIGNGPVWKFVINHVTNVKMFNFCAVSYTLNGENVKVLLEYRLETGMRVI